jgi:agmatine/peptidylarginine deiminase
MKNRRIMNMSMTALALLMSSIMSFAQSAEILVDTSVIDRAMDVVGAKLTSSAATQEEITRLANSASSVIEEFKRENDTLEALLVLNAEWRQRIDRQEQQIAELDESIANVEVVTREIPLLTQKMLASAEEFIELDYPFHLDDRRARVAFARDAITNPAVSIAERFRQVLVLYQTENSYGRTIETYPDTIEIGGVERDVNIVRIGRVALIYQTTDRQVTGAWDLNARAWVELPAGDYRTAVQTAIRVASQLDAPKIIDLPVQAPEIAQ